MPALCDVNLLLACCYERHSHHRSALAWLNQQDPHTVILCRQTQLSLLRLLTNTAVMGNDLCNAAQAWWVYDALCADERFDFYAEPPGLEVYLREYTDFSRSSPKLWQDAYLAAFARAAHLRLITFDAGFHQFGTLRLTVLD